MTSKSPVRSCEDVDETALSYAEIKALCAGNPLIAEKMNLDVEVAKLRLLKTDYQNQHYRMEDDLLKNYPKEIAAVKERIEGIQKDMALYAQQSEKLSDQRHAGPVLPRTARELDATSRCFPGMTINGVDFYEKEPAAKALLKACKGLKKDVALPIGKYMGFDMSLLFESFGQTVKLHLRGAMTYETTLSSDAFGNITRINHTLANLPKRLEEVKAQLDRIYEQQEAAKQELAKPFALADELAGKEARLALVNADLNIDGNGGLDVKNDPDEYRETLADMEPVTASAKGAKPSLSEKIEAYKANKPEGVPDRNRAGVLDRKSGEHEL